MGEPPILEYPTWIRDCERRTKNLCHRLRELEGVLKEAKEKGFINSTTPTMTFKCCQLKVATTGIVEEQGS